MYTSSSGNRVHAWQMVGVSANSLRFFAFDLEISFASLEICADQEGIKKDKDCRTKSEMMHDALQVRLANYVKQERGNVSP